MSDKSGIEKLKELEEERKRRAEKGEKIPYRLPELIKASPSTPIYIAESEKDVDSLAKISLVATCNSSGGKWPPELNRYFKYRNVYIIIPDNDAERCKRAQYVARQLDPVAASVRIVELKDERLPPGGEVSDWLQFDTAGARLSQIAQAAPLWEPKEIAGGSDEDKELIRELAALSPLLYGKRRKEAAERLEINVTELDKIVAEARGDEEEEDDDEEENPQTRKAADILIDLATGAGELFHTPDGTAYATIRVGNHLETWPIRRKGFRRWLVRQFYNTTKSAPNSEAIQAALNVIEAQACFDGPERKVYIRVAAHDGKLYLDLADEAWRAVEISADGWRIVDNPHVRFRRSNGMLPLPDPVHGGKIDELRPFLNVANDDEFVLTVSFELTTFREGFPYPVADLVGEEGSAKSTFAKVLRMLVDPNSAALRASPRDERELGNLGKKRSSSRLR